jgi:hypothetical protein
MDSQLKAAGAHHLFTGINCRKVTPIVPFTILSRSAECGEKVRMGSLGPEMMKLPVRLFRKRQYTGGPERAV